ncbi:hypothetical protein ABT274_44480 [Streptomyces sp. NPDC001127]|uniref:hypothetical protein n=1 Tax=Streptomyces sp. NPDC001127 TaxID=3154377 RepID=UPI00332C1B1D
MFDELCGGWRNGDRANTGARTSWNICWGRGLGLAGDEGHAVVAGRDVYDAVVLAGLGDVLEGLGVLELDIERGEGLGDLVLCLAEADGLLVWDGGLLLGHLDPLVPHQATFALS